MINTPKVEQRPEMHYMAIRVNVNIAEIPAKLPPLIPEVRAWLEKNNLKPDGPPFFQYVAVNSHHQMVAEVGFPVKKSLAGDGRVIPGYLPAGRYATLMHMGDYAGLRKANMDLDAWIKENGLKEKHKLTADGKEWGTRMELYLTDPQQEPDHDKWRTDVSVLVES